jgi:hypothetical protein
VSRTARDSWFFVGLEFVAEKAIPSSRQREIVVDYFVVRSVQKLADARKGFALEVRLGSIAPARQLREE